MHGHDMYMQDGPPEVPICVAEGQATKILPISKYTKLYALQKARLDQVEMAQPSAVSWPQHGLCICNKE